MTLAIRCGTCGTVTQNGPKTGFVGTRHFTCPACGAKHEFEMSAFTKTLYGSFLALLAIGMALGIMGPSIFLLLIGYAFFKNAVIANKIPTATLLKS